MDTYVKVKGRTLKFTNLEKVLYPRARFTKKDMLAYYLAAGPAILAHIHNRPVSVRRFPDGPEGESFFEKRCPQSKPAWVKTGNYRGLKFCVFDDVPALMWMVNLGAIEFHPYLSMTRYPDRPSFMVFDLDPGIGAAFSLVKEIAFDVRKMLGNNGLASWVKTSGSKGLQLYVPLNTPVTFDDTKAFSRGIAEHMERRFPDRVVSVMAKKLREGKVFIDWSQNDANKTTIAPYSMRGVVPTPSISTPVGWEELDSVRASAQFLANDCTKRLKSTGDVFAEILRVKQKLPSSVLARVA